MSEQQVSTARPAQVAQLHSAQVCGDQDNVMIKLQSLALASELREKSLLVPRECYANKRIAVTAYFCNAGFGKPAPSNVQLYLDPYTGVLDLASQTSLQHVASNAATMQIPTQTKMHISAVQVAVQQMVAFAQAWSTNAKSGTSVPIHLFCYEVLEHEWPPSAAAAWNEFLTRLPVEVHMSPREGTAASNMFFEVYPPLPVRATPNDKRMLPLSFPSGTKVHVAAEHNASHTSYSASLNTVTWTAKPGVPSYVILFARCNQQEVRDALAADTRVALQESEESLVNFCQFAMWNSSQQALLRKWRESHPNCEIMTRCLHNFVPMFGQPTILSRHASLQAQRNVSF